MVNPYAPPAETAPPAEVRQPLSNMPVASLGKRLGAWFADMMIAFVLGLLLAGIYAAIVGIERTKITMLVAVHVVQLFQWMLVARRGQTVGKMLFKIRIVTKDGATAKALHGVVLRAVPVTALVFASALAPQALRPAVNLLQLVDYAFIFTAGHRCLHDRIAGTWVVDERSRRTA